MQENFSWVWGGHIDLEVLKVREQRSLPRGARGRGQKRPVCSEEGSVGQEEEGAKVNGLLDFEMAAQNFLMMTV